MLCVGKSLFNTLGFAGSGSSERSVNGVHVFFVGCAGKGGTHHVSTRGTKDGFFNQCGLFVIIKRDYRADPIQKLDSHFHQNYIE
jgi:hypothetical protein